MEISTAIFSEFHFLRPWWLLALLPAAVFIIALWRVNSALSAWDKAIDKSLLPYLLDRSRNAAQRTPLLLLLCAWVLSAVALAGPVWEKLPQPVQQREDALVVVMDLSLSMFAQDHVPSRLDLAKRKLLDILALRDEGQTALVVYAGDAHAVMPLTDDVVTIKALVPSLSPNIMPLFGSNPMAAVDMATRLLGNIDAPEGKILLMTDGISGFDQELLLTRQLEGTPYELLILGIGTEEGAPIRTSDGNFLTDRQGAMVVPKLNRSVLQSLANRVGGRYHDIQLADSDLAYLLTDRNLLDDPRLSDVEEEFDIWHETGPWLLLLIAPLAALSFRRGWLFSMLLAAGLIGLAPAQPAKAAEWAGLWHYNRGNALALSGNYAEAIAAYDLTLAMDPEHADAIHNKAIVEQLQQQQSEQGESQEGENQNEQSEQNSDQQSEQDQENSEQQDQQSQEGDQNQQQDQQQNESPEDQEDSESNSEQNTPSQNSNEEFEERQSLEQWLRRIEDDPGELLQRKFRYQYRQRQLNGTANSLQDGGQIW